MTKDQKQTEKEMHLDFLLDSTRIKSTDKITYPEPIISKGVFKINTSKGVKSYPIPLGTKGNFSFIQAPPKHKKSFLISLLTGVYLGGSVNTAPEFKGHRDKEIVLHFDTEQGKFHANRVFRGANKLSNLNNVDEVYKTFALREYDYKTRVELIEHCLFEKYKNVGLVIIDGIIDLIADANNLEESVAIVQKLMTWSSKANCHIATVIHTTYNSSKATGHLGTYLERKCETNLHLSKNTKYEGHIDVTSKNSRGFGIENFSFFVNSFGLPEISAFCYEEVESYLG